MARKKGKTHDELIDAARRKALGTDPQGHRAIFLDDVHHPESGRQVDAVSLGLWRSRGQLLEGYEAKASRADWLRELRQPEKGDGIFACVDKWWLVANTHVVDDGELPEGWGLMVPYGAGLRIVTPAPKLEPDEISRAFLCALMRRAITGEVLREIRQARHDAEEHARSNVRIELERATSEAAALRKRVDDYEAQWQAFKAAIGDDFNSWRVSFTPQVDRIARLILALDQAEDADGSIERDLGHQLRRIRQAADVVEAGLQAVRDEREAGPAS